MRGRRGAKIENLLVSLAGDAFFKKKQKDKRKKHTTYALERPEPKSEEFDFPTYNTKALADLKVLSIKAFEISAMDTIVCQIKMD